MLIFGYSYEINSSRGLKSDVPSFESAQNNLRDTEGPSPIGTQGGDGL